MVQAVDGSAEGAFGGEGADVQLVEDGFLPRPPFPVAVGPAEGERVDDLRGAVDVVGLEAAGGIGDHQPVRQAPAVAGARHHAVGHHVDPPLVVGRQGEFPPRAWSFNAQRDGGNIRCPQAEPAPVGGEFRTEGHGVVIAHPPGPPCLLAGEEATGGLRHPDERSGVK